MNGILEKLLGLFGGRKPAPSGKKVLHVGNVANLAYVNAKILNSHGFENHVAAPDLYHFASSPQWQELIGSTVSRDDLDDDWHPNFFKVAAASGLMPDWVAQGPTHLVVTYLYFKATNDSRLNLAHEALEYFRLKSAALATTLPQAARMPEVMFREILESYPMKSSERRMIRGGREADTVFENFRRVIASLYGDEIARSVAPPFAYQNAVAYAGVDPNLNSKWMRLNGSGEAAAFGIVMDDALTKPRVSCPPGVLEEDFNAYAITLPWWKALFDAYDHVILYGSSAVLGLLAGSRYIALEHGNIRDIPFKDDALGRLTKLAYERADAVLITNSDYVIAKPRLEFEDERRYYLPHPMEDELLETYRKRHGKPLSEDGNVRFFSPARQDWQRNDPSLSKGNDRVVRAVANLKLEGIENIRVTFVDWGRDADATRDLIRELGVEDQFKWTRPLAKGDLWKAYLASHAVIDQFFLDAFGGVTYEALALGRRVITRDDGVANVEFFEGKPPPLLSAASVFDITNRMREVVNDPADSRAIGLASREWITEMHSAHRIAEIIGRVFDRVAEIGSPEVKAGTGELPAPVIGRPIPDESELPKAVVTPGIMVDRAIAEEANRSEAMDSAEAAGETPARVKAAPGPGKPAARRKPAARKAPARRPATGTPAKTTASKKAAKASAGSSETGRKTPAKSASAKSTTAKKPAANKSTAKAASTRPRTGTGTANAKAKAATAKPPAKKTASASKTKTSAKPVASTSKSKASAGKTAAASKPSAAAKKPKAQTAPASKTAPANKTEPKKPSAKPPAAKATASKTQEATGKASGLVPVSEALKSGAPTKAAAGKSTSGTSSAKKAPAKKPVAKKPAPAKKPVAKKAAAGQKAPAKKPMASKRKASGE